MRVIVKHEGQVVGGFDTEAPGPDIELDPWTHSLYEVHHVVSPELAHLDYYAHELKIHGAVA